MENKLYDVTALGELLIDFTENGNSSQGNPTFEANPGGAPCNVLAMLNRLGKKTAFIGKVGNDMFGKQLKNAVEECGIDTRNLVMDNEIHTTLAFVHTYPDGDRDFSFYRNPGADMMLTKDEVDAELIRNSRISISAHSHLHMKVSVKQPATHLTLQKKLAVSSPSTQTCARLSGKTLMMPAKKSNTEWNAAMY